MADTLSRALLVLCLWGSLQAPAAEVVVHDLFRFLLTAYRSMAPLALAALLSGCVAAPRQQALVAGDEHAQCREVFRNVDQAVARARVADGMTARVADFPYIHLCGCYHMFFPTARAAPKAQPEMLDEWAFVPQSAPPAAPGAGVTLRLEAGTHYVQRVVTSAGVAGPALEYVFADDDTLRSLPLPDGGRRSAFRADGIMPGSERGERWLFWPMGVPEAGAMRQWGRHATAFVGRRHFDAPDLLERYFTLSDQ